MNDELGPRSSLLNDLALVRPLSPPLQLALRRYQSPEQVIPGGDEPRSQGAALEDIAKDKVPPATLAAAATRLKANDETKCTKALVRELEDSQRLVLNTPVNGTRIPADERLYRLHHKLPGSEAETVKSKQALTRLELAWRAVLGNCFAPPTSRPVFAQLSARVGSFALPSGAPFCSGTLVEDGKILTARHCFFADETGQVISQNVKGLTFTLAGGAVLKISEAAVTQLADKGFDMYGDWIVLPAPVLKQPVERLGTARNLVDFTEAAPTSRSPTPLEIFAVVPLASTLEPARFPASIAGYDLPGCYVAYKEDRCISHLCNAVPGGSGASLFVVSGNEVRWAGIHLGPESTSYGSCSRRTTFANFAIRGTSGMQHLFKD